MFALHGLLIEIVFIDPLDLVTNSGAHPDIVRDHQVGQFFSVDQNDALRTPRHILPGRRE